MPFELAATVERPFISVGVEDIRNALESLPLFEIVASESIWIGSFSRGFGFDITDCLFRIMGRKIGLPNSILQAMFPGQQDISADNLPIGLKESLERPPEFIFGFTRTGDIEPRPDGIRKIRKGGVEMLMGRTRLILARRFGNLRKSFTEVGRSL